MGSIGIHGEVCPLGMQKIVLQIQIHTLEAVSYTHLDVYKRQPQHFYQNYLILLQYKRDMDTFHSIQFRNREVGEHIFLSLIHI